MARVILKSLSAQDHADALDQIRRGHVLKVDLGGATGGELEGPHFCVVVSADMLNKNLHTVIVVPLTTHGAGAVAKPYEIPLKAGDGDLDHDGFALPHQVRTIDKRKRVTEIRGVLSRDAMDEIEGGLIFAQAIDFEEPEE